MSSNEADHNRESGRSAGVLDPVSYRILDLLRENGRISIAALADKVGISRATAQRYLSALAEDGSVEIQLRYGSTGRPEHRYGPAAS